VIIGGVITAAVGLLFFLAYYLVGPDLPVISALPPVVSGVLVLDDLDLGIELELSEDSESEDDRDHMAILTSIVHGPGAVVLAVYTGPPTLEGTYVGVAESLGGVGR
jgi:hypothetical protein